MKLPRLPKLDLIPGTDFDGLVIGIVGLALLYVGTGGWVEQRWKEAAATAGPAAGTLIWGKRKGEQEGFEKGYHTYNPDLHIDELVAARERSGLVDRVAGGVVNGVTGAVVERATDMALDQLQGIWPGGEDEPKPMPPERQADPREAKPKTPRLPDGWKIDKAGRFRDSHGRIASDERRRRTLRGE